MITKKKGMTGEMTRILRKFLRESWKAKCLKLKKMGNLQETISKSKYPSNPPLKTLQDKNLGSNNRPLVSNKLMIVSSRLRILLSNQKPRWMSMIFKICRFKKRMPSQTNQNNEPLPYDMYKINHSKLLPFLKPS